MLLPALNKAKAKAKQITCTNNMKQMGLAMTMYVDDSDDYLPFFDRTGDYIMKFAEAMGQNLDYYSVGYSLGHGANTEIFSCPSAIEETLLLPATADLGATVAYSYLPTRSTYAYDAAHFSGIQGGAVAYSNCPPTVSKRYSQIMPDTVVMIEGFLATYKEYTAAQTGYKNYLAPTQSYHPGALSYQSDITHSVYPNTMSSPYVHNRFGNFLYVDGSVQSHRAGTKWNGHWQLQ
jgi:prepilin-type processing-associated H-X9-DG protein